MILTLTVFYLFSNLMTLSDVARKIVLKSRVKATLKLSAVPSA